MEQIVWRELDREDHETGPAELEAEVDEVTKGQVSPSVAAQSCISVDCALKLPSNIANSTCAGD